MRASFQRGLVGFWGGREVEDSNRKGRCFLGEGGTSKFSSLSWVMLFFFFSRTIYSYSSVAWLGGRKECTKMQICNVVKKREVDERDRI